ncbi:MAG TPA: hypothetical protein VGT41_00155 [Candidatus Babeliales bacterium]|nr:hypothetical protein [Candidatus Babeliales bacterium]
MNNIIKKLVCAVLIVAISGAYGMDEVSDYHDPANNANSIDRSQIFKNIGDVVSGVANIPSYIFPKRNDPGHATYFRSKSISAPVAAEQKPVSQEEGKDSAKQVKAASLDTKPSAQSPDQKKPSALKADYDDKGSFSLQEGLLNLAGSAMQKVARFDDYLNKKKSTSVSQSQPAENTTQVKQDQGNDIQPVVAANKESGNRLASALKNFSKKTENESNAVTAAEAVRDAEHNQSANEQPAQAMANVDNTAKPGKAATGAREFVGGLSNQIQDSWDYYTKMSPEQRYLVDEYAKMTPEQQAEAADLLSTFVKNWHEGEAQPVENPTQGGVDLTEKKPVQKVADAKRSVGAKLLDVVFPSEDKFNADKLQKRQERWNAAQAEYKKWLLHEKNNEASINAEKAAEAFPYSTEELEADFLKQNKQQIVIDKRQPVVGSSQEKTGEPQSVVKDEKEIGNTPAQNVEKTRFNLSDYSPLKMYRERQRRKEEEERKRTEDWFAREKQVAQERRLQQQQGEASPVLSAPASTDVGVVATVVKQPSTLVTGGESNQERVLSEEDTKCVGTSAQNERDRIDEELAKHFATVNTRQQTEKADVQKNTQEPESVVFGVSFADEGQPLDSYKVEGTDYDAHKKRIDLERLAIAKAEYQKWLLDEKNNEASMNAEKAAQALPYDLREIEADSLKQIKQPIVIDRTWDRYEGVTSEEQAIIDSQAQYARMTASEKQLADAWLMQPVNERDDARRVQKARDAESARIEDEQSERANQMYRAALTPSQYEWRANFNRFIMEQRAARAKELDDQRAETKKQCDALHATEDVDSLPKGSPEGSEGDPATKWIKERYKAFNNWREDRQWRQLWDACYAQEAAKREAAQDALLAQDEKDLREVIEREAKVNTEGISASIKAKDEIKRRKQAAARDADIADLVKQQEHRIVKQALREQDAVRSNESDEDRALRAGLIQEQEDLQSPNAIAAELQGVVDSEISQLDQLFAEEQIFAEEQKQEQQAQIQALQQFADAWIEHKSQRWLRDALGNAWQRTLKAAPVVLFVGTAGAIYAKWDSEQGKYVRDSVMPYVVHAHKSGKQAAESAHQKMKQYVAGAYMNACTAGSKLVVIMKDAQQVGGGYAVQAGQSARNIAGIAVQKSKQGLYVASERLSIALASGKNNLVKLSRSLKNTMKNGASCVYTNGGTKMANVLQANKHNLAWAGFFVTLVLAMSSEKARGATSTIKNYIGMGAVPSLA